MAMQTQMACRICRQPVWDISFLLVTLFWQNLSLFVCRYLTCKLGLATGRILQGFMEPYLLPSVLMATGIRLILSLCSALHCSCFRYILLGLFRYMPLKSTFRKIISPKSYEFAHLPQILRICSFQQIRYVQKNTRRNIYTEIWSELSEVYLFVSLFSGVSVPNK